MGERLPDDFDPYEDLDDMRLTEGRDPVALVGIGVTILVNLAGMAWIAGKFESRMSTAERDITELRMKASKDSEQDVKIAVISTQLSDISTKIGEINGKLESRK